MKKNWELSSEDFNRFLSWIAPDPAQAGERYESLRRNLITVFTARRCHLAEDLADETLNRAIRRLPDIIETYQGEPAAYIRAIANNLFLEYLKEQSQVTPLSAIDPPAPPVPEEEEESEAACLKRCLAQLPPESHQFILAYYQENKQAKIDHRKKLAGQMGMALNALRLRTHRIRNLLESCMDSCLENS